MSEVISPANAASPEANATEGKPVDTSPKPESVNERLLRESKEYKAKYQELKSKLDEEAKNKLVAEGNLKEALEMERKEKEDLKRQFVRTKLEMAVSTAAAKAGCVKPEVALKLGNLGLLDLDESNWSVNGVDSFIEDLKKENPYLFQTSKPPVVNAATPGGAAPKSLTAAEIAKLPADKKAEIWAKILS